MKGIIYISSLLIISVTSLFQSSPSITIDFSMPTSISAGEPFILEGIVKKGDIQNFSKLQLKVPQGFTATLIDGHDGTFTFFENQIKLIWIALPDEPEFNIKFQLIADESAQGTHNFNGKISYILDSERGKTVLTTPNIIIKAPSKNKPNKAPQIANSTSTPTPAAGNSTSESKLETTSVAEKETQNNETVSNSVSPNEIGCARSISISQVEPGKSFRVDLEVNKNQISGLGKIIESLPEGFKAKEIESNGAIFSATGQEVKFLWMTLPAESTFKVAYQITVNENQIGNKVIEGLFSYYEDEETKKSLISSSSIEIIKSDQLTPPDIASTAPSETASASETEAEAETEEPIESNESFTENETTITEEPTSTESSTNQNLNASSSVNYRVQICATKKPVNTNYFVKQNKINEEIFSNMHEGWHKFTIGNFQVYKAARNHREQVKNNNKVKGPFVTAYSDGKRITVQEALMLTKHEWMP